MKNEKFIIDNKQIAHVSGTNNLILSQWRIIRLNHNPSIIGLLLKIYLRLLFLTFWLPLTWLSTESLISEAAPHNELTFHICLSLSRLWRGLWTMSKIESLARGPRPPRIILLVSSSDTLLVVSTWDMVQDCHLRPFYQSSRG